MKMVNVFSNSALVTIFAYQTPSLLVRYLLKSPGCTHDRNGGISWITFWCKEKISIKSSTAEVFTQQIAIPLTIA